MTPLIYLTVYPNRKITREVSDYNGLDGTNPHHVKLSYHPDTKNPACQMPDAYQSGRNPPRIRMISRRGAPVWSQIMDSPDHPPISELGLADKCFRDCKIGGVDSPLSTPPPRESRTVSRSDGGAARPKGGLNRGGGGQEVNNLSRVMHQSPSLL